MSDLSHSGPRRGLFLAPFDELSDPRVLMDLAVRAESRGWDGVFVWDHIVYRAPVKAVADPWVRCLRSPPGPNGYASARS